MRLGVEAALSGGQLVAGDVEIADGAVAAVGLRSPSGRGIAAPGFVDLQLNGCAGVDFLSADADGYRRAEEALLATGVTAYLPTLVTAPEEELVAALGEVPREALPLGAHLEGPFLSANRLGAHSAAARRDPDLALLARLLAAGPVRLVTLAPELRGAEELIDALVARGITASCGHSDATAEQAHAAFDRGARTVTHLFNAMRSFHHRDPGIAGAALARDDVTVQLILDGVHLAPEVAAIAWRCAAGRLALVTDAVAGSGRTLDGALAGTKLTMLEAVRNLHALGIPLEDALAAASTVPARVLGLERELTPGKPADIVVLDDSLEIRAVYVGGVARVVC
jgi:N-acetylglucosamine-6-phosphate deacetylase